MTWLFARKATQVLATLLIAGTIAFVLLNRGAATGPSREAGGRERPGPAAAPDSRQQARPLVERVLDGLQDGRSAKSFDNPAAGASVPTVTVAKNVAVGHLAIPAMKLRSPFGEGVHDAVIDKGPGHWPGTPLPGQAGNAVLSGHRTTHGAEFYDLDVLRRGDEIDVRVGGRDRPFTYVVQGTTIVKQSRYVEHVTRQPKAPGSRFLTLFACNPVWDSTHRIVVRAEAAPVGPVEAG